MFGLGEVAAAFGVVAAVLAAIVNAWRIVGFFRGLRGRSQPQVDLDINMVGAPMALVGQRYSVRLQAFARVRLRNHTGEEARLEDPYLLWREVRLFGRRRELRKLRLSSNTDDTARQLDETVPALQGWQLAAGSVLLLRLGARYAQGSGPAATVPARY
jgi:hypothetical protein